MSDVTRATVTIGDQKIAVEDVPIQALLVEILVTLQQLLFVTAASFDDDGG